MSGQIASTLHIVPMQQADLDQVLSIEREVYEFPWTPGNFRDSLRAGYSCWTCRTEQNQLIGYGVLMFGVDEAHLLNLSIARAYQRCGYGARLLEHFIDTAREGGARELYLEVRPSNQVARRLYLRRGFHTVGLRRGYYPDHAGREDALVMSLSLEAIQ